MNRRTARRFAPVVVAVALLAGCGGGSTDDTTTAASTAASPAASQNAEVCDVYADLQKSVTELRSTPIDASGTPEQIQQQAAAMSDKALTVKADLNRLSAISNGPVAAAVGAMNQKADALSQSLTEAAANAQESIGPKISAAQEELDAAYGDVTESLDAVCPSS